jgi:hypothetical protein
MLVVLAVGAGCIAVTGVASAQTSGSGPSVDALRAQADAIANRYFDALTRSQELDDEVTRTKDAVADLEARAERVRRAARERAVIAYRQSGSRLSAVIDGEDTLDAARRARLIDHVNEHDRHAYDELRSVSKQLEEKRHDLESMRAEQAATLDELRDEGAAIDAKLTEAARREAAEQAAAAARAASVTTAPPTGTGAAAPAPAAGPAPTTTAPPTTTTAPPPVAPPAPRASSGTSGTHPHHDDPFLTCVRARESSGNYAAVNPAGPYLGAYQFLQSTWNAAANHARRSELVGVPPNTASAYDQDDMAWTLYQWQGAGPWGGACR